MGQPIDDRRPVAELKPLLGDQEGYVYGTTFGRRDDVCLHVMQRNC